MVFSYSSTISSTRSRRASVEWGLGETRELVHHLEIARDDLFHPGAQHLDDHIGTVFQRRRVHLRDRGRRERLRFESREGFGDGSAERLLDDGARGLVVERRHAVLELGELHGDIGLEQVATRGERLPELDEDGAELLERQPQALSARGLFTPLEPGPG